MKNKWNSLFVAFSIAAGGSAFPAHAAESLIRNGDFESGNLNFWSVSYGADPALGVDSLGPKIGAYSAYFGDTIGFDSISQSLTGFGVGQAYVIDFFLGNPIGGSGNGRFEVRLDQNVIFSRTAFDPLPLQEFQIIATADSANPTITFSGFQSADYFVLDNVSIVAVPELSTGTLFASGALSFGLLFLRRRNSALA